MDYRVLFADENENVSERYALAIDRIKEIINDNGAAVPYREYFDRVARFIVFMDEVYCMAKDDTLSRLSMKEHAKLNEKLYEDILGDNYEASYANPRYAVRELGNVFGRLLSYVYTEIRGMIVYAYENRLVDLTINAELFLQIYGLFAEENEPSFKSVHDALYWFVSDYTDYTVQYRIREQIDPQLSFAVDIIENANLDDLTYIYRFGEYITDNEIKLARFLNSLSEEEIAKMADTFTEGYRKGFELAGKDLSKKKTVNIRYVLGFERVVRKSIENFKKLGLSPTIYRSATYSVNKRMHIRIGYYGAIPNKQMEYDHRFDNALYLDKSFVERKLEVIRTTYETYKKLAQGFAGPAVMEVFGEVPFEPVNYSECCELSDKQKELSVLMTNESAAITNEYIKGEERSFTIIAYPTPSIGEDFEDIFRETVKINTLDYEVYKDIQQRLIDVLDGCEYVQIKGCGSNKTDIRVSVMQINNPDKETVFENCVADVNIPLGEVFTSPVLKGTNGCVNVSCVYLNDIRFDNLTVTFKDGMIVDYTCDNFNNEAENKALIKQTVLYDHDTLPMGEFAIGTNTTAYVMANRYDIVYKLPILIVEKMGPHFAVGDTCYSRSEDMAVYNPNGKEIISRDNEISVLRKTDPMKAYYNCHTDITIPYDEIGSIAAVYKDGSSRLLIENGRFVLLGCEELNRAFEG